jgi:hypothetical protein
VAVRPQTFTEGERLTRNKRESVWRVVVIVAQRVEPAATAAVDALVDLVLSIRQAFFDAGEVGGADVDDASVGLLEGELFDPEFLLTARTFIGAVTLTLVDR